MGWVSIPVIDKSPYCPDKGTFRLGFCSQIDILFGLGQPLLGIGIGVRQTGIVCLNARQFSDQFTVIWVQVGRLLVSADGSLQITGFELRFGFQGKRTRHARGGRGWGKGFLDIAALDA